MRKSARVFITGSADGLGLLAAKDLAEHGHSVTLHARSKERAQDAFDQVPGAERFLTGDLSKMDETKELGSRANEVGPFDAIIHNAAVYQAPAKEIFKVNILAPYVLTCLIQRPERLIYLSSGMHMSGHARLDSFRTDISRTTYSDSKLYMVMLCKAIARKWPEVFANALDPGWVPTKMGGKDAPDDLQKGYETQMWLAVSDDPQAKVSGRYFHHKQEAPYNPQADDVQLQDRFLHLCKEVTGIAFPQAAVHPPWTALKAD